MVGSLGPQCKVQVVSLWPEERRSERKGRSSQILEHRESKSGPWISILPRPFFLILINIRKNKLEENIHSTKWSLDEIIHQIFNYNFSWRIMKNLKVSLNLLCSKIIYYHAFCYFFYNCYNDVFIHKHWDWSPEMLGTE
jgi:hypothetical protein